VPELFCNYNSTAQTSFTYQEWIAVNNSLPTLEDIIQQYKRVFDGATLKEEVQNIFNLFITTVLPIIHMASCAKHNW